MLKEQSIISWFVKNPVASNLLFIGVIIIGLTSLNSLRKEAFPSLGSDMITINVAFDSGDPTQAEEGIAIKIENALENVPGIKRITSTSNSYGSRVLIEKTSDHELEKLLLDVKTKVDSIFNLPENAERPVIDIAQRKEHAIWVQLYGNVDRATLNRLAERLSKDLRRQPAIRDLVIQAKAEPIISIEVDEVKLQAYGLTLQDVSNAINAESSAALTTSLRYDEKSVRLKVSEQAYDLHSFNQIPVLTSRDGTLIRIGDIAHTTNTFDEDIFVLSRYNQKPAVAMQILVDESNDIVDIVNQANEVVAKWKHNGYLPKNVSIISWHDQSTLITERLSLLVSNAIFGIVLVFIVLSIFLNLKVAFWVAGGIPFVFFGSLYFMTDDFLGMTINELTTFGFLMALGIVVDDAVITGESIYSTRREEGDSIESTIKGAMKVSAPTIFGVLTTAVAFIALSNVDGYAGKIYAQFSTIVTICLLLSLIESKLILPSHLTHLNTQMRRNHSWWSRVQLFADNTLNSFNQRFYKSLIRKIVARRYAVILGFFALFILVLAMPITGAVRVAFFPEIHGDTVTAQISMYKDASYGQLNKNLIMAEKVALQVDNELQELYQSTSSGIGSLQVLATNDNNGTIRVELNDDAQYSIADFSSRWNSSIGQLEGAKKLRILSTMQIVENFKVELKAWDDKVVQSAGNELLEYLKAIKGVEGIDHDLESGDPQYRFVLTEQGRALGMDASSLSTQVLQLFGGAIVQRFQREDDEVKVRVRYPKNDRQTIADVKNANVRTPKGAVVPLPSVAEIETVYQTEEITRINGERANYIAAIVDKDILSPGRLVAMSKIELADSLVEKYPGLTIKFAGEAEERAETTSSMLTLFALAVVSIYALLAIPLKSYIQPFIIMFAIPFGIVGAILGHWINDLTISVLSLNGIFALSGVVVNDSLLLVSRFNHLVREGSMDVSDAIVAACTGRLRAVILTSMTTFIGLVPLLSETSLQAQFLIPAAASLGYGILFATLITLVLIPAMLMVKSDINQLILRAQQRLTFVFRMHSTERENVFTNSRR